MRQTVFALAALALTACATASEAGVPQQLPLTPLAIQTATGTHAFQVQVAASNAEKETGLMFRASMPADEGMIFDYGAAQTVYIWMKNTLIPLDLIYIRSDGTVSSVYEGAQPGDLTPRGSKEPVVAVLELNAGAADRIGLAPGDRVLHAIFGTAP